MRDILICIVMICVFVFGYYAATRFGAFMDKFFRDDFSPDPYDDEIPPTDPMQ